MVRIYTDANILRRFGSAFATTTLPDDLPVQLLVSPLALMEVLSQLGTGEAQEAFNAVRALPRVHNQGPTRVLPWSDDFFRMALFDRPPGNDIITPALNRAVNNILNASNVEDVRTVGEEMRDLLSVRAARLLRIQHDRSVRSSAPSALICGGRAIAVS
jgi:hypothetical protein